MAKKVPIMCSDIEIFKNLTNTHAFYFKNDSTVSFKEAIQAYTRCPKEELNLKVERNFNQSKKFTLPTYISKLLEIYKSIISIEFSGS
jgi:glycosyltransferase involved in cell wall biosynthesis